MKLALEVVKWTIAIISAMYIFQTCVVEASGITPAIQAAVNKAADKYDLDPNLILAVIEVESNFNPKALGRAGEVGLMQLHPKFFKNPPTNISKNIQLGARHLAYSRQHCPNQKGLEFLTCYNKGTKKALRNPTLNRYYKKVTKAYFRRWVATNDSNRY